METAKKDNKLRELSNMTKNASSVIEEAGKKAIMKAELEMMPAWMKRAHREQTIHMHDFEYTHVSYNCIGIDVKSMIGSKITSTRKALSSLFRKIIELTNAQSGGIGFINFDADMAAYISDESEDELVELMGEFFENLNTCCRKGCEKAYVTLNIGLDTSDKGRLISGAILKACRNGRDNGSSFIFPNIVFKLKNGINRNIGDANYDLYQEACLTTGRRMIPTYLNCDSGINSAADIAPEKIGVMGCRSRVVNNLYGEKTSIHRGNIAAVTINLVQLAYYSDGDIQKFYSLLGKALDDAKEMLLYRFNVLIKEVDLSNVYDLNYYMEADGRDAYEMLKNGTLAIGFIGIWDAISILEDVKLESMTDLIPFKNEAEAIIKKMKDYIDEAVKTEKLNFSLLASAAEGVSGAFSRYDSEHEGKGNPVSEKGYYSNSFHVPVTVKTDVFEKLRLEGVFHKYCNGGSISYVELEEMPDGNPEAVMEIVDFACESDCNYIGINFRLDYCNKCGFTGRIGKICPVCKSDSISHLRRVSGYLSEIEDFSSGKKLELADRTTHY